MSEFDAIAQEMVGDRDIPEYRAMQTLAWLALNTLKYDYIQRETGLSIREIADIDFVLLGVMSRANALEQQKGA